MAEDSRVKRGRYFIAYIRRSGGLSPSDSERIRKEMSSFNPLWIEQITPEGALFVFSAEHELKSAIQRTLDKLSVDLQILGADPIKYGAVEGDLIVELDEQGKIRAHPIGEAINQAIKRAVS
jgi:hypothetical protein